MGMVEVARDALKEIPLSEVLRERVSPALDRLAESERKIEALQTETGGLKAQLERERVDHEKTKQELNALRDSHHEEIRLVRDIEFRKGTRTEGECGDKANRSKMLTQRYISCYRFATDSGVHESTRLCSICLGRRHLHR